MERITHLSIFKKYKGRISVTFFILVLENLLQLLEPLVLGFAINGLTSKDWSGVYAFLGVELAIVTVGVIRRYYDTRAYGSIYKEISEDIAGAAVERDEDLSPAIGRADLLKEVIDFFENELPMGIASVFAVVGAFVMLFVLSPNIGLAGLMAALSIALIFLLSKKRMVKLNKLMNNELEKRARTFMSRKRAALKRHFSGIVRFQIALSDLEARNFGLSYVFVILLIAYALYETVAVQQALIGDVFAILTYASQFAEGVLVLPFMYQQYIRTQEITGRLSTSKAVQEAAE